MRRVLVLAGLAVALLVTVPLTVLAAIWLRAETTTAGTLAFQRELRIPELLDPEPDAAGRKVFDLRLQEGRSELLEGRTTATWGVNGPYLGPTLRAARGERVTVQVDNRLPEPTTVHWHGMHLPAEADGGPHQPIAPGSEWAPEWTVDQPAATLWYHPHLHEATEEHVYRGVAGMFIVDDPAAAALDLPDEYGVDDFPVIVQDKRFEDSGELSFSQGPISPIGRLGDTVLVNGTADPFLAVETRRVRLRLLNASSARVYAFGFDDDRPFDLIATDSGLRAAPYRTERIQLSPGERAEIVVEVAPGERTVLRSFEPDLRGVDFFNARFSGGDDTLDILELRAGERLAPSPPVPERLAPLAAPDAAAARAERRFELSSRRINDRAMDMARIDQAVTVDTTEIWEVENTSGIPHNFHVHDVRFQVVERDGEPPPPELRGLKDTVLVRPDETISLLIRFSDYTDAGTPYMFHCHILQHEDRGMMGQFVVVEPGRRSR